MPIKNDGNERCMLTVAYRTLVISMVDSDLPQFGVLFVNELSVHYLCIATTAGAAARRFFWSSSPRRISGCILSACVDRKD